MAAFLRWIIYSSSFLDFILFHSETSVTLVWPSHEMEFVINALAAIFRPFQRKLQQNTFQTYIYNGIYKLLFKMLFLLPYLLYV